MYHRFGNLHFSPSDLITFLDSPFASWMDRLALEVNGGPFEPDAADPLLATLQDRGYAHEATLFADLQTSHEHVVEIEGGSRDNAASQTLEALQSSAEIVFQGYLSLPPFAGYADFLVRVAEPSRLGEFSYEVWDTKLSKSLKPYFAIQLCCYAEMLEGIQGRLRGRLRRGAPLCLGVGAP